MKTRADGYVCVCGWRPPTKIEILTPETETPAHFGHVVIRLTCPSCRLRYEWVLGREAAEVRAKLRAERGPAS